MNPTLGLLGLLVSGPRHGYELKRLVDRDFSPFWRIDYAQLYRSLAKMEKSGWIRSHVESGSVGPDRKIHTLTPRGRKAFREWLQAPIDSRDELFVKVRLANAAGVAIDHAIAEQREILENERSERLSALHTAHDSRDAGRIILADAAFRDTEAALTALNLWTNIAPISKKTHASRRKGKIIVTGSDDPLLAFLAQATGATATPVGSLTGLFILARGEADVAGMHLLDLETGEYNTPFVKRLLPEDSAVLVNLAFRTNGLIVARGNPKNVCGVRDLARRDVQLVNRQRGAGTRLLLYSKLSAAAINPHSLPGWESTVSTHEAVAAAVATGHADAGPGLEAIAADWDLDFIPLGEERYDLALLQEIYDSKQLQPFLDFLHSDAFRRKGGELKGYDLKQSGSIVAHT